MGVKKNKATPQKPETIPTAIFREKIGHCDNQAEYEQLVRDHSKLYTQWSDHIKPILIRNKLSDKKLAAGCGKHLGTVSNFKKKIPTKREYVIMIAMMAKMDTEETNTLLTRWAKYPALYSKNPEDALWIYLLEKGGNDFPADLFQAYWAVYEEELANYQKANGNNRLPPQQTTMIVTRQIKDYARCSDSDVAAEDKAYREMIRRHLPDYARAYDKLMTFLDRHMEVAVSMVGSTHQLFSPNAYFHEVYYRKMGELRRARKLPSRAFLIALGVHLNLDTDELDHMLNLAGMAPLCPKDRLEGSVVFFLEELYCECPSVFYNWSKLHGETDYYKLHDNSEGGGLIRWSETADERLSEYIKRRMEETGIFDADEQKRVKEFLRML